MSDPKTALRATMIAARRAAAIADAEAGSDSGADSGARAAGHFLRTVVRPEGAIVSLYHPMRDELDTRPLIDALVAEGTAIALPVVERRHAPLGFRRWRPGDTMIPGAYGEAIPAADAPRATPDILVVPLLAFTRAGGRLGYGGGYYDRTLEALRAAGRRPLAIGYAYAAQEVDVLPLSPLDQPLDRIVTEREAILCAG